MSVKFNWKGDEVTKLVEKKLTQALRDVAHVMEDDANKTVPHRTGALELSSQASWDFDERTAAVSYDTKYALRLHESAPGEFNFRGRGRRKWLELTAKENKDRYLNYIAEQLKGLM